MYILQNSFTRFEGHIVNLGGNELQCDCSTAKSLKVCYNLYKKNGNSISHDNDGNKYLIKNVKCILDFIIYLFFHVQDFLLQYYINYVDFNL